MSRRSNSATARLRQDYLRIKRDPVPYVTAEPLPSNILEWHYVVKGPEKSPFEGGYYHGKLIFPAQFPYKPPSIYMITPNGRFKTNSRLCLSISDFHPDTWNPAWSVATILTGLLSFMLEKAPTLGSIETSDYEKRQLSYHSLEYNLKDNIFCELFPDSVAEINETLERRREAAENFSDSSRATDPLFDPHGTFRHQFNNQNQSPLQSALANIFVFLGFAAFAYVVRYVLSSINSEEE